MYIHMEMLKSFLNILYVLVLTKYVNELTATFSREKSNSKNLSFKPKKTPLFLLTQTADLYCV